MAETIAKSNDFTIFAITDKKHSNMKRILRTIAAIAWFLSFVTPALAQEKAGATAEEYGNIVVYLETAAWGQSSPYNKFCFTSNGAQAITGCVPTAYAILMHYHKWPVSANEVKVYHSGTGESMLLGEKYEWENMLYNYNGSYNDTQANAVASLMRDLGWAYGVEYGTSNTASGAGGEGAAKLMDVFKYKSNSPNVQSAQYGTVRDVLANDKLWIEYIKQSLDAGCPIPYSSTTKSGGRHIFILDGYTDNDYFHFNWGWNGYGNGWFKLDGMTPDASSDYSKSHRAYFMLSPDKAFHTVSASTGNSGAGTASVNGETSVTVAEGTTVTLQATANEGFTFAKWTLNGKTISTSSLCTVTVTGPAEYIAHFEEESGETVITEVTICIEATEGGTATVNGKSKITVASGSQITLEATPYEGYTFDEWRVGTETISTNTSFTTTAQGDRTYSAIFSKNNNELVTIEVKGSGGYFYVGSGNDRKLQVEKGSTISIRAAALEGSGRKFAYWSTGNTVSSGRGVILTNKNPYEFIAKENATFYVNFVAEETDLNVTIEANATEGGCATVYGEKKQIIALGSDVLFEATAESGYRFVCWSKGDEVISTEPFYTTVAREAMSITANFEKQIPTSISAASAGHNSVNDTKYDLSGRKIEKITKPGVYIIGSKTVVVQ